MDVEIAGAGEHGALEQAVESARGVEIDGGPGRLGNRRRSRNRGRRRGRDGRGGALGQGGHRLDLERGHRLGFQSRRGGGLRLLLGNVLALHRQDLRDLARVQIALVDQDLAQAGLPPALGLELGGREELLASDELVVQGNPPKQEIIRSWNHCWGG